LAGGNRTADQLRNGLNVDYHAAFLCEEDIQVLSNPPALARNMPPEIQAMLGYDVLAGAMGYFGDFHLDFHHPIESFTFDQTLINWAAASTPKL
jgi:ectoine hydroxylase-related dioxygenase (phytanoyl-CoA dioxygenase family)